jgi:hypothetical protein
MRTIRRTFTAEGVILAALAFLKAQGGFAQSSSYATLYSFKGGSDGASPEGVILGSNGALYGTTLTGGANTCDFGGFLCGTVFELAPAKEVPWTKTVLYSFNGASGTLPSYGAKLAFGKNGSLYGTTMAGGANDTAGQPKGGRFSNWHHRRMRVEPGPRACCTVFPVALRHLLFRTAG